MPAGMARASAIRSPAPASWNVAGRRSATSVIAGSPWRSDSPKFPCTAPRRKRRYWTVTGSLKPRAARSFSRSSAVASGGRSSAAGSPVRCRMRNTTTETPKSTSTDCHSLRIRYAFIDGGSSGEVGDDLDVRRVREHVHRLHPFHTIAAARELAHVAREGGRVARDVHHARGREGG